MKERIFTTKEQGRVLVEAGLPISTAIGFRDKYLDRLHSMEDNAGRDIYYFKGMGGHGMTDLLRNAIDDLLDTISSRETYRSAEHRVYAQMNKLTEAGAMISLAIELLTSNIRHSYGEINFERHPRPVEVEGEDKH
jgi:hypothetical protein